MIRPSDYFIQQLDAADTHTLKGHHREGCGFDDTGTFGETYTPDIAADIDARNGWLEPEDKIEAAKAEVWGNASDALGKILDYITTCPDPRAAGARAFAVALAVRPELLGVKNQSELARRLGCTRQAVSKKIAEVWHLTGGRFQHGSNCTGAKMRRVASERAKKAIAEGRGNQRANTRRKIWNAAAGNPGTPKRR